MRMAFISLLLLASAGAQTINVHQIRPGANGQVVTTVSGVSNWGPGSFTLGSTHLQLGGTYTTITGLVVNGVSLVSGGSSSLFLNQAGSYTSPPTGATSFAALLSGTNTGMAGICGTGCSLQPSGSGTITSNAVNLAGTGNGGVFGNLPVSNLNGGTGASGTTFWAGDGTWKPAGGGVLSINGVPGAFTFAGTGQSCVGTTCTFGGGGSSGITGLTAGHIPLAGSATTLTANSHIDEVTNPGSETITQPVIINDGTGVGAYVALIGGTAPPSAPANAVQLQAAASVTPYRIQLPNAQPASAGLHLSCTNADPSICAWVSPGACATCVTSAAPLTNHAVVVGNGSQAAATISADTTTTHVLFATATDPAFRAIAATDIPASLTSTTSVNSTTIPASSTLPVTIASGTSALGTGAIASATCATVVTTTATGTASTDAIIWNPNGSIKAVTGYVPATTGGLTIAAYPSTNAVNYDVCNWTSSSITPGAVTLNWRVVR